MRLEAVRRLRNEHKLLRLCRVLRVNRSTYYKHFREVESARIIENQKLRRLILDIYIKSKKRFGAEKIRQRLGREYGVKISLGRVYRLKNSIGLPAMVTVKPKYKAPKKDEAKTYENKLNGQFNPDKPNAVWVSDITYQKTRAGWCYVCVIIDLYARKVVSWRAGRRAVSALTAETLAAAMRARNYPGGVIFHSDRGVQYTSEEFRRAADRFNVVQSFSAKAKPCDNAVAESFFKFLKLEELNRKIFADLNDLSAALSAYLFWYNRNRPHSANNGLSPLEKEVLFIS